MVPQGRQLCGLQPQEPREDSTSTKRPRRVGPLGCRRWEQGREGGEMCAESRSEQLRGQPRGRGGARSPTARTLERAHSTHTPGARPMAGGRGGELKRVS